MGRCGGCEAEHVAYGVGVDSFRRGLRRFPIGNCGARVEGVVRPHPHETIATSLVAAYIGDGGRSPMPRTLPPVGPIPDLPAPNNRSLSMPRLSAFTSRGCRKECEKAIAREDEHSASARATALVGHAMSVEGAQAAVVVDDPCGRATVLASHGFEPPNVPLLSLFRAYEATRKTLGLPRNVTGESINTFGTRVLVLHHIRLPRPCVVAIVFDHITLGRALRHFRTIRAAHAWDCESCRARGGHTRTPNSVRLARR